jgi:hypothetical protein
VLLRNRVVDQEQAELTELLEAPLGNLHNQIQVLQLMQDFQEHQQDQTHQGLTFLLRVQDFIQAAAVAEQEPPVVIHRE